MKALRIFGTASLVALHLATGLGAARAEVAPRAVLTGWIAGDALPDGLVLGERQAMIAGAVLKEIQSRLGFLLDVGLDYLSLDRAAATLSGGVITKAEASPAR